MFDNLTGLTGMDAPALDGGDAPVVRYQDLQRGHSPASAGAPALNANYAPEVIEAAEEVSEIGYGPSPLEIPSYVVPYYGRPQMGYGVTLSEVRGNTTGRFPVLKKGNSDKNAKSGDRKYTGQVADLQARLNQWFDAGLTVDGVFGDGTEKAVKAYLPDSIVGSGQDATLSKSGLVGANEWAFLYDVLPDTTVKTARAGAESKDAATKGVKGTTGSDARSGAAKGAAAFLEAFNIGAGYKEDPKKKFEVSNYSEQYGEGTDWGKIALWGGVAVAGIVATVLVVRAVRSKE